MDSLHRAIWRGESLDAITGLVDQGADSEQREDHHLSSNTTVLHTAVYCDRADVLRLLLSRGAAGLLGERLGPGEEGRYAGMTPPMLASWLGHRVAYYAIAKVSPRSGCYDAWCESGIGFTSGIVFRTLNQLIDVSADRDRSGRTLLHWACHGSHACLADYLLRHGAPVAARDDFDETPLLTGSARHRDGRDRSEVVALLLAHGAEADLESAAALGEVEALRRLLTDDPGAARRPNRHGTTPLHWAARNGRAGAARLLLQAGADPNAADSLGCPPLFYAAYWGGHKELVDLLLSAGADEDFRNCWGKGLADYDCGELEKRV